MPSGNGSTRAAGADYDLLPAAIDQQHRNALARGQPGAGRGGPDDSGGVHARRIGKGHFHLVGAFGLQQVRERHAGGDYIDNHAPVSGWLCQLPPTGHHQGR